jgi:hypothetical protein
MGKDNMKFEEYGSVDKPNVLLIHGMGCTAQKSFGNVVEELKNNYHFILVSLDGYDGESGEFTSVGDQAVKIAKYLKETQKDKLFAILGMSMGGFISIDLICREGIEADKVILDSGYMDNLAFPRTISRMVAWGFLKIIHGKDGFFVRFCMRRMMGFCFRKKDLCLNATKKTIEKSEYSCITYQLPNCLEKLNQTETIYWYGSKEKYMIRGMKLLKTKLSNLKTVCVGNVGHGEVMFMSPKQYTNQVFMALNKKELNKLR